MQNTKEELEALQRVASGIDANLVLGRSGVLTPPIEALIRDVVEWIHVGLPGNSVYGPRRAGKTWALRFMTTALSAALGYPVTCVTWTFKDSCADIKPKSVVHVALRGSGAMQVFNRELDTLEDRLVITLADRMSLEGAQRVVVLIDEGQGLSMDNFMHLAYLFNLLEGAGLAPYFIVTGQPELRSVRDNWEKAKGHHITGRFFVQEHQFRCVAHADLEQVLKNFDEPLTDSGVSPVAGVLPQAYACNWRMERAATSYREALGALAQDHKIDREIPMPMSFLRISLAMLIRRMASLPYRPDLVTGALVLECLKATNFPQRMLEYVV